MIKLNEDTFYGIPKALQIDGYTHLLPRQMTASQYAVVTGAQKLVTEADAGKARFEDEKLAADFEKEVHEKLDKAFRDREYYELMARMMRNGR